LNADGKPPGGLACASFGLWRGSVLSYLNEPQTASLQVYEPVHLVVEDTGCAAGNVSVLVGATRVLAVTGGSGAQQELYWWVLITPSNDFWIQAYLSVGFRTGRENVSRINADD
jgi:hypothetical protein